MSCRMWSHKKQMENRRLLHGPEQRNMHPIVIREVREGLLGQHPREDGGDSCLQAPQEVLEGLTMPVGVDEIVEPRLRGDPARRGRKRLLSGLVEDEEV